MTAHDVRRQGRGYTVTEANHYIQAYKHRVYLEDRLAYHLQPELGWMNDPNGFCQWGKTYHLFYQHYPFEAAWGPTAWGHVISEDLVSWRHLPTALAPDADYDRDGCFSGSALISESGICLMYTGHCRTDGAEDYRQTQCLAFSRDGVNFRKYSLNPVLGADALPAGTSNRDFRDPKLWQQSKDYFTLVGSRNNLGQGQALLFRSDNLLNWSFERVFASSSGTLGSMWECPDFFTLDGRDVLMISALDVTAEELPVNGGYTVFALVGRLNRTIGEFQWEQVAELDAGFDFYAPQTIRDQWGRRLLIGWMNAWGSSEPPEAAGRHRAGAMTLPRVLRFRGNRLVSQPIAEIQNYRSGEYAIGPRRIDGEFLLTPAGESYELAASFVPGSATEFGVKIRVGRNEETVLSYQPASQTFRLDRNRSGRGLGGERESFFPLRNGPLDLHVFVDRSSVEIFLNEGEKVLTARIYPGQDAQGLSVFARNGDCNLLFLRTWTLG